MQESFRGLQRQDQIICGGEYKAANGSPAWAISMVIFARRCWAFLPRKNGGMRYGEFLRIEQGRVVEAQCFVGLAELIIALHLWPLAPSTGYEGCIPPRQS